MKKHFMLCIVLVFCVFCGMYRYLCGLDTKIDLKSLPDIPKEELEVFTAKDVQSLYPLPNREKNTPRITAVCYHEVLDNPKDVYAIPPINFKRHLLEFKASGFNFIDVSDLQAFLEQGKQLPENPLFISFDDGYTDNYTNAYPILKAVGAKATFFVVSASMEGKNRMTFREMREMLADGMSFGSHTKNHTMLIGLTASDLKKELADSKKLLEQKLGVKIVSIAYPCGYASPEVTKAVSNYYSLGFMANVDNERKETMLAFNRFGVYSWNKHISSIFKQKQPKLK